MNHGAHAQPFTLLTALYGDTAMAGIFSEEAMIESWLKVEAALALAQAECGVIEKEHALAVAAACKIENIDRPKLWEAARNVGYPILPLIRQIAAAVPGEAAGKVHYGATTQDIMDSGQALQLAAALSRLDALIGNLGAALAARIAEHASTPMAARTHAQLAVPTTFGAKLAVYLDELARHRVRLETARRTACAVSLFGAGGTAAALGEHSMMTRQAMATILQLEARDVSWHVSRDGLAEFGQLCCMLAASCARLAREIIDLSRNEIGEVRERGGHHRGASSTMPQKSNPIDCESVVGFSDAATSRAASLYRIMQPGHERAAGEWQIEWEVLPPMACQAAACLALTAGIVETMSVHPDAMRRNLELDHGTIMAEAFMVRLAPKLGQAPAHDVVYAAVRTALSLGIPLAQAMADALPSEMQALAEGAAAPENYLGESQRQCEAALAHWRTVEDRRDE